ncbi:DNA-3-methyladenine glycosylase family protein [Ethanoligenens sp.]|uniref:DNA-3-methyladenine glycosylase family protein n=1 Tax=Ethanoligenens sp. TaxID=2099655 RepID=UPI0039E8968A
MGPENAMTATTTTAQHTVLVSAPDFDPSAVFENGQCFRWERQPDGVWAGIAHGRRLRLRKDGEDLLLIGASIDEMDTLWRRYFDLDRDYTAIRTAFLQDTPLARAVAFAPGLRLLRQEPWETLCSFILSQNNNIPRIKGIIDRLCTAFGTPIPGGGFTFPLPEALAGLSVEELAPVRCGFRAKYVLDAARKVVDGTVQLEQLSAMPLDDARAALQTIHGVGPKVADCALLFGCGRLDCFPVDVWVRRILAAYYPNGFPEALRPLGGIAQQFLFHYERCHAASSK